MSAAETDRKTVEDDEVRCTKCGHTRRVHRNGTAELLGPGANTRPLPGMQMSLYACLETGGFVAE